MDNLTNKVAIAGFRSFIARELADQLCAHGKAVCFVAKDNIGIEDLSMFDCVYLVLGRAKPNPREAAAEVRQVTDFLGNPRRPRRAVYIGSMSMSEHKLKCEELIKGCGALRIDVIRPGAVFGPNQDIDSAMLIPSMARGGEKFVPDWPFLLTAFISVGDLAAHLVNFSNPGYLDMNRSGQPDSMCDVPGTFRLTPHQVHELYKTFRGLAKSPWTPGITCDCTMGCRKCGRELSGDAPNSAAGHQ